jgi:hypothetical protein
MGINYIQEAVVTGTWSQEGIKTVNIGRNKKKTFVE